MTLPRLLGRLRPSLRYFQAARHTSSMNRSPNRPPGAAGWGTVFSSSPAVEAAFGSRLLTERETSSAPEGQPDPMVPTGTAADDPMGDVAHFLAIPWCREYLRRTDTGPTRTRIIVPETRRRGPQTPASQATATADGFRLSLADGLDNAFTNTLNTPDTITSYVVFYEEPFRADGSPSLAPVVELKALMSVGAGLNGHRGIMHGGIAATILDEILGLLVPLNRRRMRRLERERAQNDQQGSPPPQVGADTPDAVYSPAQEAAIATASGLGHGIVTGYLHTTYVQPVHTSSTILVTARFVRREGPRKFYVEGTISDADGRVRVKAEAVFIALKQKL